MDLKSIHANQKQYLLRWCGFAIRTPQIMDLKSMHTKKKQYLPIYSLSRYTKGFVYETKQITNLQFVGRGLQIRTSKPVFG